MKTTTSVLFAILATVLSIETASAQDTTTTEQLSVLNQKINTQDGIAHDALFPGEGNTTLTFWTGIPYIGIVEYAYSFGNGFAAGVIGGYTPTTKAVGIRLRGIVAQPSDNFRIYLKSPFLFYPPSGDSHEEPWLLAWPTMNAEWLLSDGTRLWGGMGIIGAACEHSLFGTDDDDHGGMGFRGGVWNTTSVGASKTISDKIALHAEVAVVMKGIYSANDSRLGPKDTDLYWDGGLPLIIDIGMSYAF